MPGTMPGIVVFQIVLTGREMGDGECIPLASVSRGGQLSCALDSGGAQGRNCRIDDDQAD